LVGIAAEHVTWRDDRRLLTAASYAAGLRRPLQSAIRVTRVYPASPAAELGLPEGDLVCYLTLSDRLWSRNAGLDSPRDLAEKLRVLAGETVKVTVVRGDEALWGDLHLRPR